MDIFYRLRQFEILSHLADHQIDQLVGCTSRVRYPAGATILEEGDDSREFYFVDVGEIDIQRTTPYGRYTLARLGAGDVFGETSFVDDIARSGDAVVTSEAMLFPVGSTSLTSLMEADQKFTLALHWALWKSLSQKLRSTNENLAHFFSEARPAASPKEAGPPGSDIHVGVGAKRELFSEQQGLSPLEINFLATLSKQVKFAPDEYIFREGEAGNRLYVVLKGRVMISKEIVGAGEEALAFLERG